MVTKRNSKRLQPRYLEISHRNQVSRIFVGRGSSCSGNAVTCNDICIDIVRAGVYDCSQKYVKSSCGCGQVLKPLCDPNVATVCAKEIDEEGWAVFEWPNHLLGLKEGWYEGHINSGCSVCGEIPIRIGPRCNVIEVETIVVGPDSACYVGCDEDCGTDPCLNDPPPNEKKIYIPNYEGL